MSVKDHDARRMKRQRVQPLTSIKTSTINNSSSNIDINADALIE